MLIRKKFNVPKIKSIDARAFQNNQILTSVVIPEGVEKLEEYTFFNCINLVSVRIPSTVKEISSKAFFGCQLLIDIDISENNPYYFAEEGTIFDKDKSKLICCPHGAREHYTIPEPVITIEEYAFYKNRFIKTIDFANVNNIANYAMMKSCIRRITIGENCVRLGSFSLAFCDSLSEIEIGHEPTYNLLESRDLGGNRPKFIFPDRLIIEDTAFAESMPHLRKIKGNIWENGYYDFEERWEVNEKGETWYNEDWGCEWG